MCLGTVSAYPKIQIWGKLENEAWQDGGSKKTRHGPATVWYREQASNSGNRAAQDQFNHGDSQMMGTR